MTGPAVTEPAAAASPLEPELLLRRLPGFDTLPDEVLRRLALRLEALSFEPDAVVVREGDPGRHLYVIAEGSAEVSIEVRGRSAAVALLGAGEHFGEIALLGGDRLRTATVTAREALRLYALPEDALGGVLARFPGTERAVRSFAETSLRQQLLKRASPFAALEPALARELGGRLAERRAAAGETIIRQGELGDGCFLIRAGEVEVLLEREDGSAQRLATLGPGELFGEAALLTVAPRTASVRATSAVDLLVLHRTELLAAMRDDGSLGAGLFDLVRLRARPRRVPGIIVEERPTVAGDPITVLKDPARGAYFQLSPQGRFLWDRLDGDRSLRELALEYFVAYRSLALDGIATILEALVQAGFVEVPAARADVAPAPAASGLARRFLNAARRAVEWRIGWRGVDAPIDTLYRRGGRWLCTPAAVVALLLLGAAGLAAVVLHAPELGGLLGGGRELLWLLLALVPIQLVGTALHEVGHALAVKRYGREVREAGIGWYWYGPMAYVDTSDIWACPRGPRIAVSLAGPLASVAAAGLAALLAAALPGDTISLILWQAALIYYLTALLNLNPLLELDGYYVLMDLLERPRLRSQSLGWLGSRLGSALRTPGALRAHRVEILYGAGAIFWIVLMAGVVLAIYRVTFQGWLGAAVSPGLAAGVAWGVAAVAAGVPLLALIHELRPGTRSG
jgi:putative peptide zinc metalloprotease protein